MCAIFYIGNCAMCNTKGMVIVTLAFIHTCFRVCSVVQVNQDNQHLLNNELLTPKSSGFSDEDFYEWFRGLVDGEGCFIIQSRNNNYFLFKCNLIYRVNII